MTELLDISTDHCLIERDGKTLIVTLNRPEVRNAFDDTLIEDLTQTFLELDADDEVRAVVRAMRHTPFRAPDPFGIVTYGYGVGDDTSGLPLHRATNVPGARRTGAVDVASGLDAASQHQLWALRHAASPILAQLAPRLRSMQFIEDGCVPPDRFAAPPAARSL